MKACIVYATNSSGTLNASELVRDIFIRHQHAVTLVRADKIEPKDLRGYDLLVFGSCTWEKVVENKHLDGQLQQHFQEFVEKLRGTRLPGQKIAVFGLGDSGYRTFAASTEIISQLVEDIGAERVGEPLKLDRYYFEYKENRPKVEAWAESILQQAA